MAVVATVGARQFATVSANTITLGATGSKSQDFDDAIITAVVAKYDSTETSANGHQTKISIRNADSANNAFEHCLVTWNTGGTMTIVTRLETSTGSAISWAGQVIVTGIATYEEVHHGSIITIQEGVENVSTGLVTTSSTSFVRMSNSITITPQSNRSYLKLVGYFNGSVGRTSSGDNVTCALRTGYVTSSSVDAVSGELQTIGGASLPVDANMSYSLATSAPSILTQSELNASGDWELIYMGRTNNTDRDLSVLNIWWDWEERIAT